MLTFEVTRRASEEPFTCFVAASDRFLRVQRQFWTRRWLGSVRWSPKACIPPGRRYRFDTITQIWHHTLMLILWAVRSFSSLKSECKNLTSFCILLVINITIWLGPSPSSHRKIISPWNSLWDTGPFKCVHVLRDASWQHSAANATQLTTQWSYLKQPSFYTRGLQTWLWT